MIIQKKKEKSLICFIITFIILAFLNINFNIVKANNSENSILYESHIQDIGWQRSVKEGEISGTTDIGKRMEAIIINNLGYDFTISYQVHVENIGWQNWRQQGEMAGTEGLALRMEAIKIKINNNYTNYKVKYRVHIQDIGWQEWKENGEIAGTEGLSLRLEAIEIVIVKENNTSNDNNIGVSYISHVQNIGWENTYKYNGQMSGTENKALRLEALKINLTNKYNENNQIKYDTYIEKTGWSGWKQDGEISGTEGKSLRLEALKIEIENLDDYRIEYRAHIQNIGWTNWKYNGEIVGKENSGLRIEAIEIKIEKLTEIASNNIKSGIDVSIYQGNIDWKQVKNQGIEFVMIRAGYRGYGQAGTLVTDSKFIKNIEGALNNNIQVGIYFFTQAVTEEEAIAEANYVANLVKNYKITYPIAIDTEDVPNATGRADNLSKEERTKVVKAFCERIKQLGYKPMIYANKWWLNEELDISQLSSYDIWLAHYTGATQENPLLKPSDYKGKYIMWQYTDKGTVNGITTNVDMNIVIK